MDCQTGEQKRLPSAERDAVSDHLERRSRKEGTKAIQHLSPKLSQRAEGPASGKTEVSPFPGEGFK